MDYKLVLLVLLAVGSLFLVGCAFIEQAIDPCAQEYESCKYSCGDGWFNGLCKSACSSQYRNCRS